MIRTLLLSFLLACLPALPQTAPVEQNRLDTNQALFTVFAARIAAGVEPTVSLPQPVLEAVQAHLASHPASSLPALRSFFQEHKQPERGLDVAQYMSFALLADDPATFTLRFAEQLPPDVKTLSGLAELLAQFSREADLPTLWQRLTPFYETELARHQAPVSQAIQEANGYLRNMTSGYLGRRFVVYIELLAPPQQVHIRNYRDDTFVVVTPAREPKTGELRHAYLRHLLDPLSFKYSEAIRQKKALEQYAQGAPLLNEAYKDDFTLLVTESLTRAIESRLQRKPTLVSESLQQGFVLTPHFAEQLAAFEKDGRAMRLYYPDLIASIDLRREERRLHDVTFAQQREVVQAAPEAKPAAVSSAEKSLAEADELAYGAKQWDGARAAYLRVLKETDDKRLHARAYYGLGRAAVSQQNPEAGEKLFQRVLEMEPDAGTRAWTLVYLGRLALASQRREEAQKHLEAALALPGASESARQAAQQALRQAAAQ